MKKGKAPIIEEKVVWTTMNDGNANYCVGDFTDNADHSFIVKEVNNAPVDFETLASRVALARQKKQFVADPTDEGFSESYIMIKTNVGLDDDDIKSIKFKLSRSDKSKAKIVYVFKVSSAGSTVEG